MVIMIMLHHEVINRSVQIRIYLYTCIYIVNVHFHISSFSVDARLMDLALLTRHIGIPTAVSPWIKAEGGCGNLSLKKGQQPAGRGHWLDQGSIGWDSGVSLKGFALVAEPKAAAGYLN